MILEIWDKRTNLCAVLWYMKGLGNEVNRAYWKQRSMVLCTSLFFWRKGSVVDCTILYSYDDYIN